MSHPLETSILYHASLLIQEGCDPDEAWDCSSACLNEDLDPLDVWRGHKDLWRMAVLQAKNTRAMREACAEFASSVSNLGFTMSEAVEAMKLFGQVGAEAEMRLSQSLASFTTDKSTAEL